MKYIILIIELIIIIILIIIFVIIQIFRRPTKYELELKIQKNIPYLLNYKNYSNNVCNVDIIKMKDFNNNNKIPKNIYVCYKNKNIPASVKENYIKLNPGYNFNLYTNIDCIDFLKKEYGQLHVDIFNYIKDGPIKADFWRVCILFKYGGIYCDVDIEMLVPFNDFVLGDIHFLTCTDGADKALNPHIIITEPKFYILKNCIDHYISMYTNRNTFKYEYWKWSIVHIMTHELYYIFNTHITTDGYYIGLDGNNYQIIKEIHNGNLKDTYCTYKNTIILNNRFKSYNPHTHNFLINKI